MENQSAPPWSLYLEGGRDVAGRTIERIVAQSESFVIYTTRSDDHAVDATGAPLLDYHIAGTDDARSHLADANVLVAKIHSLTPRASQIRIVIDKQLAGAYELALRNRVDDAKTILEDVFQQLQATEIAKGQLWYIWANVLGSAMTWMGYMVGYAATPADKSKILQWVLAGALGTLGGMLSVAININKIEIAPHQKWYVHAVAGWARNIIAFLGGIVVLLAMRGKIVLHLASSGSDELAGIGLTVAECFFCFVAGFSESLVPNILRSGENEALGGDSTPGGAKK